MSVINPFPDPTVRTPPQVQVTALLGTDMDAMNLVALFTGVANVLTDDVIVVDHGGGDTDRFFGEFNYATPDLLTGGELQRFQATQGGQVQFEIRNLEVDVQTFIDWAAAGETTLAFSTILAGDDRFTGSNFDDVLRAHGGNDTVQGRDGFDTIFGGDGNDTIDGGEGLGGYLRGDLGDDVLLGGAGAEDMHGNQGNDVLYGKGGNDWVVGGQGDDLLLGESLDDLILGNLGADTLLGGTGLDVLRGGQGNDLLEGGEESDWLSGDRGFDVVRGGGGADTFHFFPGADVDRVVDFSAAEGDHVQLQLGTLYTVEQLGADTIVRTGLFDQLVLVNVQLSSLPDGWISGA